MNEYIGNNIIDETTVGTVKHTWEFGQNLMIIVVGIIYLIGIYKWFIKDKKERKLLFAINAGCDLAFIFKTTVRAFDGSRLNILPSRLFIIIQWILSIIIYKFVYKFIKEENRKLIIILTNIYLIISIIFMCIIFPNIYIPLQMYNK